MPIATSTALLIGAGVAAGGTALQAVGQVKAGNAAARAGEYNAQTAELNAARAIEAGEFNAQTALEAAGIRETQIRKQARRLMATQRAIVGASGVLLEGSPLDVIADTAYETELDALLTRREGALQADAARRAAAQEAEAQRREAQSQRLYGKSAQSASRLSAGATILGGGYDISTNLIRLRGTTPRAQAGA